MTDFTNWIFGFFLFGPETIFYKEINWRGQWLNTKTDQFRPSNFLGVNFSRSPISQINWTPATHSRYLQWTSYVKILSSIQHFQSSVNTLTITLCYNGPFNSRLWSTLRSHSDYTCWHSILFINIVSSKMKSIKFVCSTCWKVSHCFQYPHWLLFIWQIQWQMKWVPKHLSLERQQKCITACECLWAYQIIFRLQAKDTFYIVHEIINECKETDIASSVCQ